MIGNEDMTDSILTIENDAIVREGLASVLAKAGFAISTVPDYSAALLKLNQLKADLVIVDAVLLSMDGIEACQQIRSNLDIPVVLLGEDGRNEAWRRVMECSDVHYQIKPFSYRILVARVKAILRRNKVWRTTDLQSKLILFQG